jgi:hypothetical protein
MKTMAAFIAGIAVSLFCVAAVSTGVSGLYTTSGGQAFYIDEETGGAKGFLPSEAFPDKMPIYYYLGLLDGVRAVGAGVAGTGQKKDKLWYVDNSIAALEAGAIRPDVDKSFRRFPLSRSFAHSGFTGPIQYLKALREKILAEK